MGFERFFAFLFSLTGSNDSQLVMERRIRFPRLSFFLSVTSNVFFWVKVLPFCKRSFRSLNFSCSEKLVLNKPVKLEPQSDFSSSSFWIVCFEFSNIMLAPKVNCSFSFMLRE